MPFSQKRLEKIASNFHTCLFETDEAEPARRYLSGPKPSGRGLDLDLLSKYDVGFCPPDILYPDEYKLNVDGHLWYMRGRVIFTIRDLYGRIVGFNGRRIDEMSTPLWESLEVQFDDLRASELIDEWNSKKWVNESYAKAHHLFRLYDVHKHILDVGAAVIVEGCMDTVMMDMHGLKNTVSILGTRLSDVQLALLKRFTDHLVLCFDSDAGGESVRTRLEKLLSSNDIETGNREMTSTSIILPVNTDPEDILSMEPDGNMFHWAICNASEKQVDGRTIDFNQDIHRTAIIKSLEDSS